MDVPFTLFLVATYVLMSDTSFISNPSSNVACNGKEYSMIWNFDETTNFIAVLWSKDGQPVVTWIVSTNQYVYGVGYNSTKVSHTNTNGAITIHSVMASDVGSYTCSVTYSTGLVTSTPHTVSVQNPVNSSVVCEYHEVADQLNCSLPLGVNNVTVNKVPVSSFPVNGNSASWFEVCMNYTSCFETDVKPCSQYLGKSPTTTTEHETASYLYATLNHTEMDKTSTTNIRSIKWFQRKEFYVGIGVGATLSLLILVIICCCIYRKTRSSNKNPKSAKMLSVEKSNLHVSCINKNEII